MYSLRSCFICATMISSEIVLRVLFHGGGAEQEYDMRQCTVKKSAGRVCACRNAAAGCVASGRGELERARWQPVSRNHSSRVRDKPRGPVVATERRTRGRSSLSWTGQGGASESHGTARLEGAALHNCKQLLAGGGGGTGTPGMSGCPKQRVRRSGPPAAMPAAPSMPGRPIREHCARVRVYDSSPCVAVDVAGAAAAAATATHSLRLPGQPGRERRRCGVTQGRRRPLASHKDAGSAFNPSHAKQSGQQHRGCAGRRPHLPRLTPARARRAERKRVYFRGPR